MDHFDFIIIGAGPGGEAAAYEARTRGASVAVIDEDLFGGSCPHWGCIPSKTLLHAAAEHAEGADYDWPRASARRDYMINREKRDYPDDSGHVKGLEAAGALTYRGTGALDGRSGGTLKVSVTHDDKRHELTAANVLIAVGSGTKMPPIEGIETVRTWTNKDATGARELPKSLLVLGGGPTGVELAEVYARFGVPTTVVQSGNRLIPTDHPRNSEAARLALIRDGVDVRLGVRAIKAEAGIGPDGADVIQLDNGSTAHGHAILLAVGRTFPLEPLHLETVGIDIKDRHALPHDGRLRIQDGLYLIGDPAGPELHTHQAHYQGQVAVRMALGDDVKPDYRALPRATYTDPELASVGVTLDEATGRRPGRVRVRRRFPDDGQGLLGRGHLRPRHDRRRSRDPRADRRGDGHARRLGGDPRMRPGDQGPCQDRGPGRHDPRLPVDLADLQRPVRRGLAQARLGPANPSSRPTGP